MLEHLDGFKPHILVVTVAYEDGDGFVEYDYELLCPGVTNHCRAYLECFGADCNERELQESIDRGDDPVMAHGKAHKYIDLGWCVPTDYCLYAASDQLDDAAGQLGLPTGEWEVDVDYAGDGIISLIDLDRVAP
jgi:hypothetical protein